MPGRERSARTRNRDRERRSSGSKPSNSNPATTPVIQVEQMYQIYEKLNSAEDKTKLESEYRKFLDAVHCSEKEKRLASQFITRFVENFPNLWDDAVNAMLDLCEEEDASIRKQVQKDLVTVCKKVVKCVPKISDVFCQLMLTADQAETVNLHTGLISLFHIDAKGTLSGIFSQIKTGQPIVREGCFKFMHARLKDLSLEIADFNFQKLLYAELKKIASVLSQTEFKMTMEILLGTKLLQQVSGHQLIMDLLCEQLCLDEPLEVVDKNNISRLMTITDYAIPLFSSQISCNQFIIYYFTKVLPRYSEVAALDNCRQLQLGILKRMDDLLFIVKQLDDADIEKCLPIAFNMAMDILPIPPTTVDGEVDLEKPTGLSFTTCECILYAIHKLGSMKPEFLQEEPRLEAFRKRLQYLNRAGNVFDKKILADFTDHEEKKMDLQSLENRRKIIALKVVKNLNAIIRDLFQKPPKYTATLKLSWKPLAKAATKRTAVVAVSGLPPIPPKTQRIGRDRELARYQPPGGKYSRGGNFGAMQPSYSGRGRGAWSRGRRY